VDFKNGSSALITILIMIVVISIAAFGFIILVDKMDQHVITTNTSDLTGINYTSGVYTSDIYNATNETAHGLSNIMPNFIWIVIIFFMVVFLTILALALKQH